MEGSIRPALTVQVDAGSDYSEMGDSGASQLSPSKQGSPRRNLQKQILWTKTFKTLTRAIDDLYLACEMERDSANVSDAIKLLRRAAADFELLQDSIFSSTAFNNSPVSSANSHISRTSCAVSWEVPLSLLSDRQPSRASFFPPSRRTTSELGDSDSEEPGDSPLWGHSDLPQVQVDLRGRYPPHEGTAAAHQEHRDGAGEPEEAAGGDDMEQRRGGSSSSAAVSEAWKDKRNWEAILVGGPGQQQQQQQRRQSPANKQRQLHKKLMSPDRKRRTPQETKKRVDEKQASALERRLQIDNERAARLARAEAGRQAAAQAESERLQALVQDISERHQRSAAQRLAHLDKVARKAGDEIKKVREVAFIQELTNQGRRLGIQEKLEESEARRLGRLEAVREKQRDTDTAMELAQERRQLLETEKLERLALKERKKADVQAKLREERRAEQRAREVRSKQQRAAAEERAAAKAAHTQQRSDRLEVRLREADNRRLLHLENIKERATLSKDERRETTTPTNSPTGHVVSGGESSDGGHQGLQRQSSDRSIKAAATEANRKKGARRRLRKILKQLEVPLEEGSLAEPPRVIQSLNTFSGSERCAHWRCATAKLERLSDSTSDVTALERLVSSLESELQQSLEAAEDAPARADPPGAASTSEDVASQDAAPLIRQDLLELHAARVAGTLKWVSQHASQPRQDWGKALQLRLLRMWLKFLSVAENCEAMLSGTVLCVLAKRLAGSLGEAQDWSRPRNPSVSRPASSGGTPNGKDKSRVAAPPPAQDPLLSAVVELNEAGTEMNWLLLEAMLKVLSRVVSHQPENEPMVHRHVLLISFLISSGVLRGLRSLFSVFDCLADNSMDVPPYIEAGLEFLKELTGSPQPQALRWPLTDSVPPGSSVQALILALKEEWLVGLTSLLTGVLLRASPDGCISDANPLALPRNFTAVAATALRALTNAAMLDVVAMQGLMRAPDLSMESYHLVYFLLSFCTMQWDDTSGEPEERNKVRELLNETLLFIGLSVVGSGQNQDVMQWGKSPNILQLLCQLPFPYFADPHLRGVLLPTLLCVCYDNSTISKAMEADVAMDFLLQFVQEVMLSNDDGDSDGSSADVPGGRYSVKLRFPRDLWGTAAQKLKAVCE